MRTVHNPDPGLQDEQGPQRPLRRHPVARAKNLLVGPPMVTERLIHERLGKPTALAVFASDNLSSSAYATEEVLRVLVPVIGAAAFSFVLPVTMALLAILAVLLFSYRQTIKAYPQAGGAYLVTRDNFGLMPAQLAGVALLTDYILTVSVSVAAGTAALTSAVPGIFPFRVHVCLIFIALIAWGNLRGVKESGKIFAVPTYFFVVMMGVFMGSAAFRLASGTLHPVSTFPLKPSATSAVSVFLILRAFSSGGAAVTGVEAISNGVPAFKAPEWKNARTTLMWMGALLGLMVLSTSVVAVRLRVVPDPTEKTTILAQLGSAVFGASGTGKLLFYGLQAGTVLILIMAANTSFADFPRLASFHAGDSFLPRQLTRYGDRLVYSNGIIVLAFSAAVPILAFDASVTRLIPLYAIGVFTSFTFSQSGMVRRHLRRREKGWRSGLAINGIGALTTGIMTVVIAATKFADGAWLVLLSTPLLLWALIKVNKHYEQTARSLRDPAKQPEPGVPRQRVIVPAGSGRPVDALALAYGRRVFPIELKAVAFSPRDPDWEFISDIGPAGETREVAKSTGRLVCDLRNYIRRERSKVLPGQLINVLIPETVTTVNHNDFRYLLRHIKVQRLKAALVAEPDVVVTNITHHKGYEAMMPQQDALLASTRGVSWQHVAILLVGGVHNATLKGLRYARSLGAERLVCVHVENNAEESQKVVRRWDAEVPGIPLHLLQSPHRQITGPIFDFVRDILVSDPKTFVTLVIPEFLVGKAWHTLLHNKTALMLKATFLYEPSVVVSSVPYRL